MKYKKKQDKKYSRHENDSDKGLNKKLCTIPKLT